MSRLLKKLPTAKFLPTATAMVLTPLAAAVSAAQLEEVVVTAQKHAQSVNDVGITVNAYTGDTIKDLGVSSAEDIAAFTPGLSVTEAGAVGVPVYTIRGVGFQDITTSSSSTVGLYFDEVAIPYTVMSRGALFDIERVEVLKGPQGDLYGRNTTAGQINYISKKPTEEFEAGITAGYGRFNVLDLEGYLSGQLADGLLGRVSFKTTQSNEGWQRSLTRPGDELGEKDISAIRALFNIDLSDSATLLLNFHYVDDQSDNQAQTAYDGRIVGLPETPAPYFDLASYQTGGAFEGQTPPWYSTGDNRAADWTNEWVSPITGEVANLRPRRDNQLEGVSAKLEWEFDNFTLTSLTAFDNFERVEANDVDGTAFSVQENINETDMEVFSQELRLTGDTERLLWIAGLYYSKDDVDEFYNFFMQDSQFGRGAQGGPFAVFPIFRLHTRYQQETESKAIFGHVEYDLNDKWRLTLGARYTEEERDWTGCTFDGGDGGYVALWGGFFGATLQPGACSTLNDTLGSPNNIVNVVGTPNVNDAFQPFTTDITTEKWMGKISLDYKVSEDVLTYATLSNGFKSGGFNGNNSNTTSQLAPYEPEELTSIELGLKATLLDGSMQLNAAIFHYDYEDKQEQERAITPVGAIGGLGNIPESEIRGGEIDLQWTPTDGLLITLGAAYLDTEIKEWVTPAGAPTNGPANFDFATGQPINVVFVDASGTGLPQSPELAFNGMFTYEWSVGNDLMMEVSMDVNYTDDLEDPVRQASNIESYTLTNARIALANGERDWRVMLWGRNITDEYYYPAAFAGVNGVNKRVVGMPRTYGISLEYNF